MPTVEPLGPLYSQTTPPGLVRLMGHLLAKFPGTRNGGMYNPASSLSGGGPSPHRVTQALDVMCDRDTAPQIIRYMVSIAESVNLQQCIAWHEIITVQRWPEGIRYYPAGDHSDGNGHAHIHVGLNASRNWSPEWVGGAPAPGLTPEQLRALIQAIRNIDNARKDQPAMPKQVTFSGHSHVFAVQADGRLRHDYYNGSKWQRDYPAEVQVPAARFTTDQTLDVKTKESGQSENPIDVYALGKLGEFVHCWWTGTTWGTEVFA